jgi:Ca2+-binding RTX toxin-like protein
MQGFHGREPGATVGNVRIWRSAATLLVTVSWIAFALVVPAAAAGPCDASAATILGTAGDDVLRGTPAADVIVGLDGNDSLTALAGDDVVCGGPGNDVVRGGDGDDLLRGDDGVDVIAPGAGDDVANGGDPVQLHLPEAFDELDLRDAPDPVVVDLTEGVVDGWGADEVRGFEVVTGSPFDDRVVGSPRADFVFGGGGDDVLDGSSGWDRVDGQDGNDLVVGGWGRDTLFGGAGRNRLLGGSSRDELRALDGSTGNVMIGGPGNDALTGSDADEVLAGGAGSDVLEPSHGDDAVRGGQDVDTVSYWHPAAPAATHVEIDLAADTATGVGADDVTDVENAIGTFVDDRVFGDSGPNRLQGSGVLAGLAGDDVLQGTGDLRGGSGDDDLCPCLHRDVNAVASDASGGEGRDRLLFSTSPYPLDGNLGPVTVDLAGVGQTPLGPLTVAGVEDIFGTPDDDVLLGDDGPNVFRAGEGVDVIDGRGGDDRILGGIGPNDLTGGSGDDEIRTGQGDGNVNGGTGFDRYAAAAACCTGVVIDLAAQTLSREGGVPFVIVGIESVTGTRFDDVIRGSTVADVLSGWLGDDSLEGRGGDDVLRGGDGSDTGNGGAGSDRCVSVEAATSCAVPRQR